MSGEHLTGVRPLFEWLVVSVVDLLDFDRGEVVERAVDTVGVEPGHPFGGDCFDVSYVTQGSSRPNQNCHLFLHQTPAAYVVGGLITLMKVVT